MSQVRCHRKPDLMRRISILTCLIAVSYFFLQSSRPVERLSGPAILSTEPAASGVLTRLNFNDSIKSLYHAMDVERLGLDYTVFRQAMTGFYQLRHEGAINNKNIVTIIDFSKPGTEKRFYTLDLTDRRVLFHTYVAHGRNTGQNLAEMFSNTQHSNQSSLGFVVTAETYTGSKGYSLRLDGKEASFNSNVRKRAVVIHAAPYATEEWINRYGRLGRSQGCPALPPSLSREIIDTIKNGTAVFTYYPDDTYLRTSRYLKTDNLFEVLDQQYAAMIGAR